jgi:membrane-associated phospholipid phosphatase
MGGLLDPMLRAAVACSPKSLVAAACAALALSVAPPAAAQPADAPAVAPHDDATAPSWKPRREIHVSAADLVVTGAAAGIVVGAAIARPQPDHWRGGILFDEDARDFLRLKSLGGRYAVRDASDVGVSLASTWPFLVDALVTAWWYRGRADLARNMAMANDVGSRERPFGRLCGKDIPEDSVDCDGNVRFRSFFSGHTTLTFVSAGVLCSHHLGLGLLGPTLDVITCAGGFAVAAMTSVFRMMSDMHYATDVAVGAVVGSAFGFAVPWLHFRSAGVSEGRPPSAAHAVDLRLAPVGRGIGIVGSF